MKRLTVKERFDSMCHPEPNSGCILWSGCLTVSGYGRFQLGGKARRAHRVAWSMAGNKPVANLLHKCDVRCCVNVDHLFVGSAQDNMADMAIKGRGRKGKLPNGVKKRGSRFEARCRIGKMYKYLGMYDTVKEAADIASRERLTFGTDLWGK